MAIIYLQHPKHGAKVAISQQEAENDIQNGWKEFDPTESEPNSAPEADVVTVDDAPVDPELVNALQPRRRGRRAREALQ